MASPRKRTRKKTVEQATAKTTEATPAEETPAEEGAAVQSAMQRENAVFTSVSNVLKTRHDTAKNSISNVR